MRRKRGEHRHLSMSELNAIPVSLGGNVVPNLVYQLKQVTLRDTALGWMHPYLASVSMLTLAIVERSDGFGASEIG
jgi:hypothetical protein